MKIKTNNHFRPVLSWHDLTEAEQRENADAYDGVKDSSFFRYRGHVYDLCNFMYAEGYTGRHELFPNWDGYHNDSYFSAVLVKYSECQDFVKVGLALS